MVPLRKNICPKRPSYESTIADHLIGFVDVGDELGGVAKKKHDDNGGKEGDHGGVSSVIGGDRVVQNCCSAKVF